MRTRDPSRILPQPALDENGFDVELRWAYNQTSTGATTLDLRRLLLGPSAASFYAHGWSQWLVSPSSESSQKPTPATNAAPSSGSTSSSSSERPSPAAQTAAADGYYPIHRARDTAPQPTARTGPDCQIRACVTPTAEASPSGGINKYSDKLTPRETSDDAALKAAPYSTKHCGRGGNILVRAVAPEAEGLA